MADQFIGKVLAEKYQINSLLSEGELGNLYHGTHLLMEKPVAVKILLPQLADDEKIVKSFADEARTVSRISHPNILNVTDYGSDKDNGVFIVYEDLIGESLKATIERIGRFSLKRANKIVKEIASVLSVAHSGDVIHQNLSSQNIWLNNGSVKVLNFGTKTFDINDLDYPIEKIEYLAPEQCSVSGKIDQRTDVYALGVILFEMLTGGVPLTDSNGTDLLLKQTQEPPPPLTSFRTDLPNEVDDVLLKALAKNPEIRYQSVDELANELNQISLLVSDADEEETIVTERAAVPANAAAKPEQPQNNLWKTAFIVLAGVTLLGASFIYLTSGKQTNPSTQIQTDANGSPVQPAPPPTGMMEQTLSNMDSYNPELYSNSNSVPVDGGGYTTPWDRSSNPPPGAPQTTGGYGDPYPVYPSNSGQTVYVDPANGSIFMPVENSNRYVIVNANKASNVNTQPKKNANTNANVSTPPTNTTVKPSPTPPAANTAAPKATPTAKPTEKPKTTSTPPTDPE